MADEERLAGVLGLAAPLQAAVQAAVQGKPTAEALAWLSGAQRKLEADSKTMQQPAGIGRIRRTLESQRE